MKFPARVMIALAGLTVLGASPTLAAPNEGFSLSYGVARHTTAGDLQDGTEFDWSAKGSHIAFDYQIPTGDHSSLNIGMVSTTGAMTGTQSGIPVEGTAGYVGLVLQGRLWAGGLFVGVHVGSFIELVEFKDAQEDYVGSGTGWGYALGFEGENWFMTGTIDLLDLTYPSTLDVTQTAEGKLTGSRFAIGYRWS